MAENVETMQTAWDLRLVALSYLVACFASFAALDLAGMVANTRGWWQKVWLLFGASAMGMGIWAMHFTGMLAFEAPVPISYDIRLVAGSMAVAVAASALALLIVSREDMSLTDLFIGGPVMGVGIAGMHYTGMAAMRIPATVSYDTYLFVLSIFIAVGASIAALGIQVSVRQRGLSTTRLLKFAAALVMGLAITGVYYTAMAAVSYAPTGGAVEQSAPLTNRFELGVGIGAASVIILCLALAGSFVDRRMASQAARIKVGEQRYSSLFLHNPDAVFSFDLDGRITSANYVARNLLAAEDDLVGSNVSDFFVPEDRGRASRRFREAGRGGSQNFEAAVQNMEGRRVELSVTSLPIMLDGEIKGVYTIAKDITERKALEERLTHQALHDPLTGLPNRALFSDRISHALARASRPERRGDSRTDRVAVLFMDLDNFKVVNDSLGHEAGDILLIEAAGRLSSCLRSVDTVARLGGDEFAVLLEGLEGPDHAAKAAERVSDEFARPFEISESTVFISASIGIAASEPGEEDAKDVIRRADLAMYGAKKKGKAGYEVFDPSMNAAAHARLGLESDLRRALERNEFKLHYQPEMRLDGESGAIVGLEALVRWEHPEKGLVPPDEFIPLAEETGLIVPIGSWVLGEACMQAKEWREAAPPDAPPMMISVNLSARQFQREGLALEVARILEESGLPAECLNLEITESVVMDDAPLTMDILASLKALGVKLSIDDFGTGYSSLSYLRSFPVDFLKVDRSFVSNMGEKTEDLVIVSGIVSLAQDLGLKAIAEGVETPAQLESLKELGCDLAQGYLFSKPVPAAEIEAMLGGFGQKNGHPENGEGDMGFPNRAAHPSGLSAASREARN